MPSRRRLLRAMSAATAVVGSAVLAACGRTNAPGGSVSGGVPPTTGSAPGSAPGSGGVPGPAPLPDPPGFPTGIPTPTITEPVAGERRRSAPFVFVLAQGTSIVVQVISGGPPCDAVTGTEVIETSGRVVLTVWTGPQVGAGPCDGPQVAMAAIQWIRVPLAAPLGTRELIPGRTA
jgi:hypothetical protein